MTRKLVFASLAPLSLALAPACNKGGASGSAPAISPQAKQEAQEIFASRCSVCHGAQGAGDGAGSAGLTPSRATSKTRRGRAASRMTTSSASSRAVVRRWARARRCHRTRIRGKTEVLNALAAHVRGSPSKLRTTLTTGLGIESRTIGIFFVQN